jgi:hypothetical protein
MGVLSEELWKFFWFSEVVSSISSGVAEHFSCT